jgi:hypothetical protein
MAAIPTGVTSVAQLEAYNKTGAFSTPKASALESPYQNLYGDLGPVSRTSNYGIDPTNPFGIFTNPTTGVPMVNNNFQNNFQNLGPLYQDLGPVSPTPVYNPLNPFNF